MSISGKGARYELAIYLRDVNKWAEFYTMSGIILRGLMRNTQFYLPGFVSSDDLDIIRPFLPTLEAEQVDVPNIQRIERQIPREVSKPLVEKMQKFLRESEEIFRHNIVELNQAHSLVAKDKSTLYVTLNELAEVAIGTKVPRTENGSYPYPALYALHRSVMRNEIGFRPQLKGATRTGGQYEVSSKAEVRNIISTVEIVRRYQNASTTSSGLQSSSILKSWVEDCQRVIDESRKSRQLTAHGTLKTLTSPNKKDESRPAAVRSPLTEFIKSWAAFRTIDRDSSINTTGSALLRAVGRYDQLPLDQTTAWTLLQEIGVIEPTENRVAYDLRLHNHGLNDAYQGDYFTSEDSMSALRRDFHLPVYCIDAASAHEVDDGVSIERTETPNEYWVHVHAADPASRLEAKGKCATEISNRTETVYAPEKVHFLLPSDFVQDNLSLDTNRPSLTFSAKMNMNGDILETYISPRTILDVKFLTPEVVEEVITGNGFQSSIGAIISSVVGPPMSPVTEKRTMLQIHQLSQEQKDDLRTLYAIGDARLKQRRARGGVSMNSASTDVVVSPTAATIQVQKTESTKLTSKVDAVAPLMLIAAEVAARWCHDRGVPIPYRITSRNFNKKDPLKFYKEVVLPSLDEHGNPPIKLAIKYFQLLGSILPSTTPGPHVAVGVEMMAKCTSPLRRYGDLLLHWQIHAALREEARMGNDLIGNTKEHFLPFSKAELDRIISHLDARERMIKQGNKDSLHHWLCHFLLRAWKFGEAPLPSTFRFVAASDALFERAFGKINFFDARVSMVGSQAFDIADVKAGEALEVKLKDVNVYSRSITVEAIRRLK